MTSSAFKFWLALAGALAAIYGSFVAARYLDPRSQVADVVTAPQLVKKQPRLTEFQLTDQSAGAFDSRALRGQVWVASFFFTNCPGTCLQLNRALANLQQANPDSPTRYVSITCDPENDTPEALAKYAAHFQADPARWTFLTGEMNLIRRIGQEFFQISVDREVHSDRACVVDRQGKIRGRFRLTQPEQVEMLKKLLAAVESEPPANLDGDAAAPANPAAEAADPSVAPAPATEETAPPAPA